ncbi:MAG: RyR domain-containing protein [Pseudomonadota bacterium]
MTQYTPKPIDTSNVVLDDDLVALTETLAESTHDVWARQRFLDGWTHGPMRDDAKRQHPSLVPYAELPDDEREYDRRTAIETLKAIVALGYRIVPPKG